MKINDHCITVSAGHISIGEPLSMGDTVTVIVEGDVVQVKQDDNQDGTYDLIYKIKGAIAQVQKHGDIISSEDSKEL
jgi:hypothetical protein